ncbi:hypothetical protein PRVXH_001635 [Proteinivorax hydrogeniformans]|uniref:Uncharacterized protein n=1 Tax=Proteinivorax hydrogeniformans TaxID=1826727 RepID=A0AAU8HQ73_9FIRM
MGYKINLVSERKTWANLGSFIEGQLLCDGQILKKTFSSMDFHIPTWIYPSQKVLRVGTSNIIQVPHNVLNAPRPKSMLVFLPKCDCVTLYLRTNLFLDKAQLLESISIEINNHLYYLKDISHLITSSPQKTGRYFIDLSTILN